MFNVEEKDGAGSYGGTPVDAFSNEEVLFPMDHNSSVPVTPKYTFFL